jgi:hypothetical protein
MALKIFLLSESEFDLRIAPLLRFRIYFVTSFQNFQNYYYRGSEK